MVGARSPQFMLLFISMIYASLIWALVGCTGNQMAGLSAEILRTPEGLAEWQRGEDRFKKEMQLALEQYQQEAVPKVLKGYETAVRGYLDHGFGLYRAYRKSKLDLPADLIPSLEQRTSLLMDVADEYIKHGSLAMGESIAADVVHNYSDLPTLTPAQRRAEAVLLRYRYRQDY